MNRWSCFTLEKYQNEVDMVLERSNDQIIGVEVKASATIKLDDFKGLIKLAQFNPSKFQYGVIFYAGKEILTFNQNTIRMYALPMSMLL